MMKARIFKTSNLFSPTNKRPYKRIFFKTEEEEVYITDVVPGFRNFKNWEGLTEEGNVLDGLVRIGETNRVDADSKPTLVGKEEDPQLDFFK